MAETTATRSSKSSLLFPLLAVAVGFGALLYGLLFSEDASLLGSEVPVGKKWDELLELEKGRWNGSVEFSFFGAKSVPVIDYNPRDPDFIDNVISAEKLVLIRGAPTRRWMAISKWSKEYFCKHLPVVAVHVPPVPVVRLHQMDELQAFSGLDGVNWTRPWVEKEVYTKVLFEGNKYMYHMSNLKNLPGELQADVHPRDVSVVYSPPMEVNLWMGTPRVTTPAHYDLVHNFYAQIRGRKRFILFDADQADKLYTFTSLHPSARQSQINFNDPEHSARFPGFSEVSATEVVLSPGDLLYIPPFHFHYVSVVGDEVSMSISTHTESQQARVREVVMGSSSGYFEMVQLARLNLLPRINLFKHYVLGLFVSKDEAFRELDSIIKTHWSHFDLDNEAVGLKELVEQGRDKFPSKDVLGSQENAIPPEHARRAVAAGAEIRGLLRQFRPAVERIMLTTHIEQSAADILGALNVDPFLRHLREEVRVEAA